MGKGTRQQELRRRRKRREKRIKERLRVSMEGRPQPVATRRPPVRKRAEPKPAAPPPAAGG
jgi:hypothetical protein